MNEETVYKKWLEARGSIKPHTDITEKTMTRIVSLPSKSSEVAPPDPVLIRLSESLLFRAGLALGLSLLGLIRVAYVSRLILIP